MQSKTYEVYDYLMYDDGNLTFQKNSESIIVDYSQNSIGLELIGHSWVYVQVNGSNYYFPQSNYAIEFTIASLTGTISIYAPQTGSTGHINMGIGFNPSHVGVRIRIEYDLTNNCAYIYKNGQYSQTVNNSREFISSTGIRFANNTDNTYNIVITDLKAYRI